MPTMNISLPNDLNDFVIDQLNFGGYNNQSEVVREGLRLLRNRQEKLLRLRSDIQAGAGDLENGNTKPLTDQLLSEIADRARRRAVSKARERPDRA